MPGLFDDLIPPQPTQAAAPPSGAPSGLTFDDLIPKQQPRVIGRSHNGGVTISVDPNAPAAPSMTRDATGFMANLNRGLGVGDEMAAGLNTAADVLTGRAKFGTDQPGNVVMNNVRMIGDTYRNELAGQRAAEDSYRAAHPNMAALAKGSGMALTMAAPIGPGAEAFQGGNLMTNAVRGATVAGLTGAGYAAVDRGPLQDRIAAAARAAHDPVTLGLGAAGGSLATLGHTTSEAPTLEDLTAQKDAAYKAVDESGVTYTPEAMKGLASDINDAMAKARFNPNLHKNAAPVLDQINEDVNRAAGYSPSLTELDQLRRQVRDAVALSPNADESRIGKTIVGKIDDFIASTKPDMLSGAEGADPAAMLATARDLNTRVMKLQNLDQLDEAAADRAGATGTGRNIGNATRQNVIRFQNSTGNLTPDEQAAVTATIRGTPVQNALREVGRLSPEGGTVPAGISLMTGPASHGVIPATGFVARRIENALTARNVGALRDLIATGGQAAEAVSQALSDPQYADLRRQLANDLSVQAGVQGAGRPSMTAAPPAPTIASR